MAMFFVTRFRRAVSRVRGGIWSSAWRGLRVGAILRWSLMPARPAREASRILVVYDFSHQPVSVGDLLVARVAAEALQALHGAQHADMAFLHEVGVADGAPLVDMGPAVTQVGHALQALRLDPDLGSVLFFSERLALEDYVDRSPAGLLVWPPAGYYAAGQYVYYLVWNELLHEHFVRFGRVPQLRAAVQATSWAGAFISGKAGARIPLSIQLRRNPLNPVRDSDFDAWLSFLAWCERKAPHVCFFLVGSGAEEDPRMTALGNVIAAKAFHTTLEQDLALIGCCRAHMGASSGPSTMAFFSDKPYALFGWKSPEHRYRGLRTAGDARMFFFASDDQRLVVEAETPTLLEREFQRIMDALGVPGGRGVREGGEAAVASVPPAAAYMPLQ